MQVLSHSIKNLAGRMRLYNVKLIYLVSLLLLLTLCVIVARLTFTFLGKASTDEAQHKQAISHRARLSEHVSIHASGRGNPWINLSDGRDLVTEYSGPAEPCQILEQNQAKPLSLCSGDFDEDGVTDLISSYAGPGEGIITLMRGNVDTIYPNSPEAKQRRAEDTVTESPFLSPARVFSVPEGADFIGSGDFDADGHWDVIAARRGGNKLYLLKGDGRGGFSISKNMDMPGMLTAMVIGEINRKDGLEDVIVGITAMDSAKVLVFEGPEGAIRANPEVFELSAKATSLALGQLDSDAPMDLVVAAGRDLIIVRGRNRTWPLAYSNQSDANPLLISKQSFPFAIRSVIIGDFIDENNIALLSEDGAVYLASEGQGESHGLGIKRKQWKTKLLGRISPNETSQLVLTRMTSVPKDTLLALNQRYRQLEILIPDVGAPEQVKAQTTLYPGMQTSLDLDTEPLAILPLRLNQDALSDLVILASNQIAPAVLMTAAGVPFTVKNTNDSGPESLRQAIMDSNDRPGADIINFNIPGGGVPSIKLQGQLPSIRDAVTIDGTTQSSGRIELDGSFAGGGEGLVISAGNTTVRGLVINRWGGTAIRMEINGNNFIEGNYIGTDITGTIRQGVRWTGVWADGSSNNTIGGTRKEALNLISGNNLHGIEIKESINNKIQGNYIGTDITGSVDLGNLGEGILFFIGARDNVIGGTTPGAGNVISGNDGRGIGMYAGASGNSVQGNLIGTNAAGTNAIGNSFNGINITGAPNNNIGGTSHEALNVISGNNENGIAIGIAKDEQTGGINTLVQGNYIGTDINGVTPIANLHNGIFVDADSVSNIIEKNRIAFNNRNGIEIPNAANINRSGIRITITSNAIFSNGGLPIDLGPAGVSLNDPLDTDIGANTLQNFPLLTSAVAAGSSVTVKGVFNSSPNSRYRLQFFHAGNCGRCIGNASHCLLPLVIATEEVRTDSQGRYDFRLQFLLPPGRSGGVLNCTATSLDGNTSEESPTCVVLCTCVCPADMSVAATSSSGTVVSYSMPNLEGNCSGARLECSPPSNSTFQIGITTVTCTVADTAGNTASCDFKVTVTNRPRPVITSISRSGKKLYVSGETFDNGAVILINGQVQKTSYESRFMLIGKKAGKIIRFGDRLRVRNPDQTLSDEFTYSPSAPN